MISLSFRQILRFCVSSFGKLAVLVYMSLRLSEVDVEIDSFVRRLFVRTPVLRSSYISAFFVSFIHTSEPILDA